MTRTGWGSATPRGKVSAQFIEMTEYVWVQSCKRVFVRTIAAYKYEDVGLGTKPKPNKTEKNTPGQDMNSFFHWHFAYMWEIVVKVSPFISHLHTLAQVTMEHDNGELWRGRTHAIPKQIKTYHLSVVNMFCHYMWKKVNIERTSREFLFKPTTSYPPRRYTSFLHPISFIVILPSVYPSYRKAYNEQIGSRKKVLR